MATRHCTQCGDLPIDQFTTEIRSDCRACYNAKRRLKNTFGSEKLKQGTWIGSTELSNLHAQIEALQARVSVLTAERSVVDQQLQIEIASKEQYLKRNMELESEVQSLKVQLGTSERDSSSNQPVLDYTHRLSILEFLSRETQSQMSKILDLMIKQSKDSTNADHPPRGVIPAQVGTISEPSLERPVSDQLKPRISEQIGPIKSVLSAQSVGISNTVPSSPSTHQVVSERPVSDQEQSSKVSSSPTTHPIVSERPLSDQEQSSKVSLSSTTHQIVSDRSVVAQEQPGHLVTPLRTLPPNHRTETGSNVVESPEPQVVKFSSPESPATVNSETSRPISAKSPPTVKIPLKQGSLAGSIPVRLTSR